MVLVRSGIKGWVLNAKNLPGKPDFYFHDKNLAVFIDGCYWHGCPRCGHIPKTRSEYWKAKISRNIERDREKSKELSAMGIKVMRIWEHELKESISQSLRLDELKSIIY